MYHFLDLFAFYFFQLDGSTSCFQSRLWDLQFGGDFLKHLFDVFEFW